MPAPQHPAVHSGTGSDQPLDADTLDGAEAEARAFLISQGLHA